MEQPIQVWSGHEGRVTRHSEHDAAQAHRGWIFGSFIKLPDGQPLSQSLEIKKVALKTGESRDEWSSSEKGECVEILLSGKLRKFFKLDGQEITVDTVPGDVISWLNTVPHRWLVLEDAEMVCIRTLH